MGDHGTIAIMPSSMKETSCMVPPDVFLCSTSINVLWGYIWSHDSCCHLVLRLRTQELCVLFGTKYTEHCFVGFTCSLSLQLNQVHSYTLRTLCACNSQSHFTILKICESMCALFWYNCTPSRLWATCALPRTRDHSVWLIHLLPWVTAFFGNT